MLTKVIKVVVLIFPVFLPSQAFWWRSSSTEAPSPAPAPVMKQIPLTYFRTYTYQQPLTSSPVQLPLLSSTDYITNYNALTNSPYYNPMMPVLPVSLPTSNEIPLDTRPSKRYEHFNMVRSLGPLPVETTTTTSEPTTSTTTTTTTTTEPTTTTTSTTEPPITLASSTNTAIFPSDPLLNIDATFPAFNRKAFNNHFNINYHRPVYPYPQYSLNERSQASSNIEFVPCMCPVSISNAGLSSGLQSTAPVAGNPSSSIFLAQGRTNVEAEASLDAPLASAGLNGEAKAAEANSNSMDGLEVVKLNEDEEAATSSQIL